MTDHVLIPRATLEQINAAMYLSHWTDKFIAAHMAVQAALAAPCEPVAHQYQARDGSWHPFLNDKHKADTEADGTWPIRALYTPKEPT